MHKKYLIGMLFHGNLSLSAMGRSSNAIGQMVVSNTSITCAPKKKCYENGFSGVGSHCYTSAFMIIVIVPTEEKSVEGDNVHLFTLTRERIWYSTVLYLFD